MQHCLQDVWPVRDQRHSSWLLIPWDPGTGETRRSAFHTFIHSFVHQTLPNSLPSNRFILNSKPMPLWHSFTNGPLKVKCLLISRTIYRDTILTIKKEFKTGPKSLGLSFALTCHTPVLYLYYTKSSFELRHSYGSSWRIADWRGPGIQNPKLSNLQAPLFSVHLGEAHVDCCSSPPPRLDISILPRASQPISTRMTCCWIYLLPP